MAKTYTELIIENLSAGEWVPESKLLSGVVRLKFGISRASAKRASGVKSQLAGLLLSGDVSKGLTEDGKIFWRKGDGIKNNVILISEEDVVFSSSKSILIQKAQVNIKFLEEFLIKICLEELIKAYGENWQTKIPQVTFDKLNNQLERSSHSKWTASISKNLFETANIIDFVDIMRDSWTIFKPIFNDKEITIGKLKEIAYLRNAIQHNKVLSVKDYIFFNLSVELFLEKFER